MPDREVYEAMQTLGTFMEQHSSHGGKCDIEPDRITLWCDGCQAYEIITMDNVALRRAMGAELSEQRAVSF